MLRIVLPFVTAADVVPITALNVVNAVTPANIRIAIEIVVHVDVDVVVSPAAIPAPASSSPRSADGKSHAE
jgi:hypothetical protein